MWLLLTITPLIVAVILMLHWLNIISLTHVFTSDSKLSKLVITTLDDPKISGTLTLTVTVFFLFSNSLTTILLVVVSAVFSLHWLNIVTLPGFFPSAVKDPKISGAATMTIIVSLSLLTSLTTTVLAAVNVVLWFLWLKFISLKVIFEWDLLQLLILVLDDWKLSGALTLTITVFFFMSNTILTTFLVTAFTIFSLHWFNIVTLTNFFPPWLKNPKISGVLMVTIAVLLTVSTSLVTALSVAAIVILWSNWLKIINLTYVFTSERNFSELIFTALCDPKISGALTPTITVFFFMSNIVVITLSVVVFAIFSLHQFNIITLTHIFDLGLNNPKVSGVLTVTITVLLTLSNSLTATFSVAVIVTLWLDWLNIITLTDAFKYARNLSELVISALDDPNISSVLMLSVTMLFIFLNSVTTNLSVAVIVTLCLNWLDIITLTDAFTYARSLSELVISVLDDPKISSMVTLTVAVLFIFSSSLTSTLLVVVSVIFSLHWLNIVTLPGYVPSAFDNPAASRAVAVTIAAFLTLSNPLIIVLAALNFVLWLDWLEISTLTEFFTLGSESFMSFISEFSDANTCTDSKSKGKDLKSRAVKFEDVKEGIRVKLGLPKRNSSRKTTQVKLNLPKTDIRESIRVRLGLDKLQITETVEAKRVSAKLVDNKNE